MQTSTSYFQISQARGIQITSLNGQENSLKTGESLTEVKFFVRRILSIDPHRLFVNRAHNIVMRYPSYSVTFHGICYGPEGTEEFGPCSQMAVFHLEREEKYDYVIQPPGPQNLFETVATFEYPTLKDTRSDEEKLVDDAIYYINFLAHHNEDRQEEIPLKQVLSLLKVSTSAEALKVLLLEHGMVVKDREDGPVALPFEESTSESSSNESDAGDFFDDVTRYNQYDPENMDGPLTADEESSLLQSSQTSDWNEDCILIPQNRSVVHENTLFDEEILPVDDFHASEVRPIHSSDSNNLTVDDTAGGITIEGLPSNSIPLSLNTNELNGKTQIIQSDELTIMLSTIPSNSSAAKHATKRLVDIVTIEPALSQEDELSLRSMQRASELNCQPHLSVSRSSTSPEPLYVSFGLNNSLQNCSTNQTESYQTKSLNNSFCHSGMVEASENVEYVTACSANGLNNSSRENHSQISKINLLENSGVSSCNNERADNIFDQITNNVNNIFENQPKFTSSPRKMVTTLQREDVNSDDPVSVDSNMISTRKAIEKTVSNIVENSLTLAIINEISKSIVDKYDVYKAWPSSNDIKKNNAAHRSIDWYSASKKTQQEIHSENGACRTSTSPGNKGTNGEYPAAKNVIDKETDAGNVQKIDAHVSSLYDTITRDDERRNVIPALSNVDDHAEVYPDNAQASDHSRANVNKRCLSPPRGFFGSKLRRNCKCSSECAKEASILEDELAPCTSNEDANNVQSTSMARNEESFDSVTREIVRYIHVTNISRFVDKVDTKPSSPLESPPNSWSPEVMDSGYPNTASAQDITPEYDLSSIAQDQIPDSESPSVAEAPRFGILEPIEVENGDLANNNRDDEGNNMMAADADDNEDLQPFIDVLENDLENENDIYVMQNGFPVWLLRILDMANPLDFDMQARQNLRAVDEVAGNFFGLFAHSKSKMYL